MSVFVLKLPVIIIVLGLQNHSIKSSFFYKDQMPSVLFSYNLGTIICILIFFSIFVIFFCMFCNFYFSFSCFWTSSCFIKIKWEMLPWQLAEKKKFFYFILDICYFYNLSLWCPQSVSVKFQLTIPHRSFIISMLCSNFHHGIRTSTAGVVNVGPGVTLSCRV